ncbi:MAG: hydantoinase/oxoprolinase family protein [Mesorhizobium sp.]
MPRHFATPLWRGLHLLTDAFAKSAPHCRNCSIAGVTMTGELTDAFPSRQAGVAALLEMIGQGVPVPDTRIYAGRSGFVPLADAPAYSADIASANWHATAALVGKQTGNALFVDMGSTTTDIIATRDGSIANIGYTDSGTPRDWRAGLYRLYPHLSVWRCIQRHRARTNHTADERVFRRHR